MMNISQNTHEWYVRGEESVTSCIMFQIVFLGQKVLLFVTKVIPALHRYRDTAKRV